MNFNTYLLGAMTVVMEWPFETCMSQCTISAQHFLHPCVASYRILLQKWLMCYFSCLVMQLLWAPGHCSKALGPAQNRDTGSLVLRGPRGAPGGLVSCLHSCHQIVTCALQWCLWSKGMFSNPAVSARKFPAPNNLYPFLSPSLKKKWGGVPLFSPNPHHQTYATISFIIVTSSWGFFLSGDISLMEIGRFRSAL